MHGPSHEYDEVDIDKEHHDGDTDTNSPENGTNVPDLDSSTSSVLTHDYFKVVHGHCSCDDQNEIGNQKGSASILETQVGESEIQAFRILLVAFTPKKPNYCL